MDSYGANILSCPISIYTDRSSIPYRSSNCNKTWRSHFQTDSQTVLKAYGLMMINACQIFDNNIYWFQSGFDGKTEILPQRLGLQFGKRSTDFAICDSLWDVFCLVPFDIFDQDWSISPQCSKSLVKSPYGRICRIHSDRTLASVAWLIVVQLC